MTRTFCDICGKAITNNETSYSLSLIGIGKKKENELRAILNKNNILYSDVCDNYAGKIKFYIDSIKKENNDKE